MVRLDIEAEFFHLGIGFHEVTNFSYGTGRYARNLGTVLGDLERRARLPYAGEPPPDGEEA